MNQPPGPAGGGGGVPPQYTCKPGVPVYSPPPFVNLPPPNHCMIGGPIIYNALPFNYQVKAAVPGAVSGPPPALVAHPQPSQPPPHVTQSHHVAFPVQNFWQHTSPEGFHHQPPPGPPVPCTPRGIHPGLQHGWSSAVTAPSPQQPPVFVANNPVTPNSSHLPWTQLAFPVQHQPYNNSTSAAQTMSVPSSAEHFRKAAGLHGIVIQNPRQKFSPMSKPRQTEGINTQSTPAASSIDKNSTANSSTYKSIIDEKSFRRKVDYWLNTSVNIADKENVNPQNQTQEKPGKEACHVLKSSGFEGWEDLQTQKPVDDHGDLSTPSNTTPNESFERPDSGNNGSSQYSEHQLTKSEQSHLGAGDGNLVFDKQVTNVDNDEEEGMKEEEVLDESELSDGSIDIIEHEFVTTYTSSLTSDDDVTEEGTGCDDVLDDFDEVEREDAEGVDVNDMTLAESKEDVNEMGNVESGCVENVKSTVEVKVVKEVDNMNQAELHEDVNNTGDTESDCVEDVKDLVEAKEVAEGLDAIDMNVLVSKKDVNEEGALESSFVEDDKSTVGVLAKLMNQRYVSIEHVAEVLVLEAIKNGKQKFEELFQSASDCQASPLEVELQDNQQRKCTNSTAGSSNIADANEKEDSDSVELNSIPIKRINTWSVKETDNTYERNRKAVVKMLDDNVIESSLEENGFSDDSKDLIDESLTFNDENINSSNNATTDDQETASDIKAVETDLTDDANSDSHIEVYIGTAEQLKDNVKTMKEIQEIPQTEKKPEDREKLFFKAQAKSHGISIVSPHNDDEYNKDNNQEPKPATTETDGQMNTSAAGAGMNRSRDSWSAERRWSLTDSLDNFHSKESSVSDSSEAFRIKASLHGIHIVDPRDQTPTSEVESDISFTGGRIRHLSVTSHDDDVLNRSTLKADCSEFIPSGRKQLSAAVPEFNVSTVSVATSDVSDKLETGMRANAPEFNVSIVSIARSDVSDNVETSMRVDAPEFKPSFSFKVQKQSEASTTFVGQNMNGTVCGSSYKNNRIPDATSWDNYSSNVQVPSLDYDKKKEINTSKIAGCQTSEASSWDTSSSVRNKSPCKGIQASPVTTDMCIGTRRTKVKHQVTETSMCQTREVAINTVDSMENEDSSYYREISVKPVTRSRSTMTKPPKQRSVGVNVYTKNAVAAQCENNRFESQVELLATSANRLQLQVQHFRFQEMSLIETMICHPGQKRPKIKSFVSALIEQKNQVYKETMTKLYEIENLAADIKKNIKVPDKDSIPSSLTCVVPETEAIPVPGSTSSTGNTDYKDISNITNYMKASLVERGMMDIEDSDGEEEEDEELQEEMDIPDVGSVATMPCSDQILLAAAATYEELDDFDTVSGREVFVSPPPDRLEQFFENNPDLDRYNGANSGLCKDYMQGEHLDKNECEADSTVAVNGYGFDQEYVHDNVQSQLVSKSLTDQTSVESFTCLNSKLTNNKGIDHTASLNSQVGLMEQRQSSVKVPSCTASTGASTGAPVEESPAVDDVDIDPDLFQAVLAQLVKAYPELDKDHEKLLKIAMQQTKLLQVYVNVGPGGGATGMQPGPLGASKGNIATASPGAIGGEIPGMIGGATQGLIGRATPGMTEGAGLGTMSSPLAIKSGISDHENSSVLNPTSAALAAIETYSCDSVVPVTREAIHGLSPLTSSSPTSQEAYISQGVVCTSLGKPLGRPALNRSAMTTSLVSVPSSMTNLKSNKASYLPDHIGERQAEHVNTVSAAGRITNISLKSKPPGLQHFGTDLELDNSSGLTTADFSKIGSKPNRTPLCNSVCSNTNKVSEAHNAVEYISGSNLIRSTEDLERTQLRSVSQNLPVTSTHFPHSANIVESFSEISQSRQVPFAHLKTNSAANVQSVATAKSRSAAEYPSVTSQDMPVSKSWSTWRSGVPSTTPAKPKYVPPPLRKNSPPASVLNNAIHNKGQAGPSKYTGNQQNGPSFKVAQSEDWDTEVDIYSPTAVATCFNNSWKRPASKPEPFNDAIPELKDQKPWIGAQKSVEANGGKGEPDASRRASELCDIPKSSKGPEEQDKIEEGAWCKVQSKKRHSSKEQTVKESTKPSSVPVVQNKTVKKSNFERLVNKIHEAVPHADRQTIIAAITKLRQIRGSLSGLAMEVIIDKCRCYILSQSDKPLKQPVVPQSIKPSVVPSNLTKAQVIQPVTTKIAPPRLTLPHCPQVLRPESPTDDNVCVICFESLQAMEIKELDCYHIFHKQCISQWVERERTCPTCRQHALFPEEFPRL